jgi:hypothetical protein
MRSTDEIENIEEMRRQQGIEDIELQNEVRALRTGDVVKLTLISANGSSETLPVRITSIKGSTYRGKLSDEPMSAGLSMVKSGSTIVFDAKHIHSVPRKRA